MDVSCLNCGKTNDETSLRKCPVCFKYFCEDHSHIRSGRAFCSSGCGEYFFFSEPDD